MSDVGIHVSLKVFCALKIKLAKSEGNIHSLYNYLVVMLEKLVCSIISIELNTYRSNQSTLQSTNNT